ncbi:MAG TPA: hypothetical protein VLQ52_07695 [Coriobacteriia bacterium]|nr:hypothetical protein [Coriobacteriia bacterium]
MMDSFLLDGGHRAVLLLFSAWRIVWIAGSTAAVFGSLSGPDRAPLVWIAVWATSALVLVSVRTGEVGAVTETAVIIVKLGGRSVELPLAALEGGSAVPEGGTGSVWRLLTTRGRAPWRRRWLVSCTDQKGLADALADRGVDARWMHG